MNTANTANFSFADSENLVNRATENTASTVLDLLKKGHFLDLTHPLNSSVPTWSGSCGFEHTIKMDYPQGCRAQSIRMQAGVGTHMDAPSHFIPNGSSVADLPLEKLIVPAAVIDVSHKMTPAYELTVDDIREYESKYGRIANNSLVIAYTGWDQYWSDTKKYRNAKPSANVNTNENINLNANGEMEFPGFSLAAAEMLVERGIAGIGIDTLSPECKDKNFPVHHCILGAGCYILENLNNCKQMPATGAYVIALPLRVENGTESAIRAVAILP